MDNEEVQAADSGHSLLDAVNRPLSDHFGYTLASFLTVYIFACVIMFM